MNEETKTKIIYKFLTGEDSKKRKEFRGMDDLFISVRKFITDERMFEDFIRWIHNDTLHYKTAVIPEVNENISIVYKLFGVCDPVCYITFMTSFLRAIDNCIVNKESKLKQHRKFIIDRINFQI